MSEPIIVTYDSANGSSTIHARIWEKENARGIVQIVHGMAEHSGRYDHYARWLNDKGFIVCADDHAGHGLSIGNGIPGYMGDSDGWRHMLSDVDTLHQYMQENYGPLPYFLLGHSMGAIMAAIYPIYFGTENLNSVILTGVPGRNPFLPVARLICKMSKGDKPNNLVNKLAFGNYNKSYSVVNTAFDWITSDPESLQEYLDDPLCGFTFTSQGFHDMFTMLGILGSSNWAKVFPKDMAISIYAGTDDPVTAYGEGAREYYQRLYRAMHPRCAYKLYPARRHELLQEKDREEIYEDILSWMEKVMQIGHGESARVFPRA